MSLGLLAIISGGKTLSTANSQLDNDLLDAVRDFYGNAENVKKAIESGANVNTTDPSKRTALHRMVTLSSQKPKVALELIQLLINKGADPNAKDDFGWTPLHIFAVQRAGRDPKVLETLIDADADINAKDSRNRTPIFYIVTIGWDPLIEFGLKSFIEKGANIFTSKDEDGETIWEIMKSKSFPTTTILELFFPLKKMIEDVENEPFVKMEIKNTATPFLKAILEKFSKQLSDKEESTTLTKEQIEELKKIDAPLTDVEKATLISIVQKFIKLLYIGQEQFENELSQMKNRLGFSVKEMLLYNKLFEKTSPLLNLLAEYSQGFSNYGKFYMKKNLQQITPKLGEKKPQLSDINISFEK